MCLKQPFFRNDICSPDLVSDHEAFDWSLSLTCRYIIEYFHKWLCISHFGLLHIMFCTVYNTMVWYSYWFLLFWLFRSSWSLWITSNRVDCSPHMQYCCKVQTCRHWYCRYLTGIPMWWHFNCGGWRLVCSCSKCWSMCRSRCWSICCSSHWNSGAILASFVYSRVVLSISSFISTQTAHCEATIFSHIPF